MMSFRFLMGFVVFSMMAGSGFAATDTVYVKKRVVDTVFVASPPDTVYIQESVARKAESQINPYLVDYDTDTIPPAINSYVGMYTALNILSLYFGVFMLDWDLEIENAYRGSTIFNLSTTLLFYEYRIWDEERSWEGVRSIFSPGVGYRQYLLTVVVSRENRKRRKVKHRNVPLNSVSFYVQAMGHPTIKVARDKPYDSDVDKKWSFDAGVAATGTLGLVWNAGNYLWDFGFSFGYQYWGSDARDFLSLGNMCLLAGTVPRGMFFGLEYKLGF